jgi:hypothetical protein
MTDQAKKPPCGCGVSSLEGGPGGATNSICHCYTGGVSVGGGRRIRVPRIVLVLWDHFFITNPAAVTNAQQLITDLVTGPFMNGLVQYGISRGSLVNTITLDTNTFPAPTNWDSNGNNDQAQVLAFLNNNNISPKPAVNENSLLYFFLLPTSTTLTNGKNKDGSVNTNVCGWHKAAKLNSNSHDDDVFWGVVRTDSAPKTSGQAFVDKVAFCVGHEMAEAFTDRDGGGYTASNGCEIGDICELVSFSYRIWTSIEQYWSNWDAACIQGSNPVRMRQYLAARKLNPAVGLRTLRAPVISTDWMASTL